MMKNLRTINIRVSNLVKLFDIAECVYPGGQKAPLPVMGPGNHSSQSLVMTLREEATTNQHFPPCR